MTKLIRAFIEELKAVEKQLLTIEGRDVLVFSTEDGNWFVQINYGDFMPIELLDAKTLGLIFREGIKRRFPRE